MSEEQDARDMEVDYTDIAWTECDMGDMTVLAQELDTRAECFPAEREQEDETMEDATDDKAEAGQLLDGENQEARAETRAQSWASTKIGNCSDKQRKIPRPAIPWQEWSVKCLNIVSHGDFDSDNRSDVAWNASHLVTKSVP